MLGRLAASDIFLNNSDRVPVKMIWASPGNPQNFVYEVQNVTSEDLRLDINDIRMEFNCLCAVDNSSNPINETYEAYGAYMKSVDKFISFVLAETETNKKKLKDFECVKSIVEFLSTYFGIRLNPTEQFRVA